MPQNQFPDEEEPHGAPSATAGLIDEIDRVAADQNADQGHHGGKEGNIPVRRSPDSLDEEHTSCEYGH